MRIGCKTMRDGVIVSLVFAAMALGLWMTGRYLLVDMAFINALFLVVSATLLLFVPFILLGTFLRNRPAGNV